MKLKDMTIGQRIAYRHFAARGWPSHELNQYVTNPKIDETRLANAIDRELRKVAERFWVNGKWWERYSSPRSSQP